MINLILDELSSYAKAFPRSEKVLIVPSYQVGRQLLTALVRSGVPSVNTRVETVMSLASKIAEDVLASNSLNRLTGMALQMIVENIFNELADSGKLKYFEKHPINMGMIKALTRTICELRLCAISPDGIAKGVFVAKTKEADLRLILSEYESVLKKRRFIDDAALIELAWQQLSHNKSNGGGRYFLPSSYCMRGLERKFIEELCGKNLIVLYDDSVFGLDQPAGGWKAKDSGEPPQVKTDIERLKWLFSTRKAPKAFKDGTIEIFSALGCRNEVREVIRRIISGGVTADDVEIICTAPESYGDLIFSICEKMGIPVTFADGIPGYLTGAGRAIMGFLRWVKEDFNELYLRRIFESGGFKWKKADEDGPGASSLGYLLRTSGIGWGRARYDLILSKKIEECVKFARDLREDGEEVRAVYQEKKAEDLSTLKGLCEELLGKIPLKDANGKIEFKELCEGCSGFIEQYVKAISENDGCFVAAVKDQLEILSKTAESKMTFDEAVSKLIAALSDIRLKASGPKPGHLYVSNYKTGGWSGRAHTYITGLDEGKFPKKIVQDPILLDDERKKISPDLELSPERISKDLYDMAQVLSRLRGSLTVSYPCYDIKENRRAFPSSIVLQIYRVKEGYPKADYNALFKALGEPVGFNGGIRSKIALDETDWWINSLAESEVLKDGTEALKTHYDGIEEGLKAEECRKAARFSEYDGKVVSCGDELDPRVNRDMTMSPTRLESAARCPFSYFMENILKIKKPDELEKDAFMWLDALERGSLLHEVFQKFIEKIRDEKKKDAVEWQKRQIDGILDDVVKRYKETVPPPSDAVFQSEFLQLKRDVEFFLKVNRELGTEPVACEAVFGGDAGPVVKIPLGGGKSFLLRGKIDRIDKAGPSEYHVWDYKTGSSYGYEERGFIVGGKQLQHALYAVAAEIMLKKSEGKDSKVTSSGYLFPTEKGTKDGKGGIFPRPTDKKKIWQDAMGILLDFIGKGNFMVSPDEDACMFCDYGDVCGGAAAKENIEKKLGNHENQEILIWENLKEIE